MAVGGFIGAGIGGFIVPQTLDNLDWHGHIANLGWEVGGFGLGLILHRVLRV